jgi:hypothetical protein
MIDIDSAVAEIQLLKPKNGNILVFRMHRAPEPSDSATIMRILNKVHAQVLVFLLGPGDSIQEIVDQQKDEWLLAHGLQRIPKASA